MLPPFDLLLNYCNQSVRPANPEMIPEIDLSEEATREFYAMDNFMYGTERIDLERQKQNINL